MSHFPGVAASDILLPREDLSPEKWAVIACDQFTSQPEYWKEVEALVGEAPSALHLMQPEAFLDQGDPTENINATMKKYLQEGILQKRVENGFLAVERTTVSGKRLGLVAALDLECYDFTTGKLLTRATEDTVADRLPPRVKIREGASLELPHVMVLIDDPECSVIEPLVQEKAQEKPLYDFELMMNGGHLRGWGVTSEAEKERLSRALLNLEKKSEGFLYAVGDGNHSLATAKICWENIKKELPKEKQNFHPARYALAEIVNLHSPAILFEAIHRVLFRCCAEPLIEGLKAYARSQGIGLVPGEEIVFVADGSRVGFRLENAGGLLPVALLQSFLDRYLAEHPDTGIDYIHGEKTVLDLARAENTVGILLQSIPKDSFFAGIRAGGHLPRKTFSMGHAEEKRYYMECRKLID